MAARKAGDWIEGFLRLTENTESPKQYRLWTAVSIVASALRRKCFLKWGNVGTLYPNMYIVLVGPSGARKTTAMRIGEYFLNEVGIAKSSEAVTREALIGELEEAIDTDPVTLLQHSSLTVFAEELVVFLGKDNEQLMSNLCAWYDCKDVWNYKTKNSGENEIDGVWVNLIGATTPTLIRSNLPIEAVGGGLASRCIFVYARRKAKSVPVPFETPDEIKLKQQLLHDYHILSGLQGEFKFTDAWMERWIDWYTKQESEDNFQYLRLFEGYSSRRPVHVLKLCMILAASRDNRMLIDETVFETAISYLKSAEVDMTRTFEGLGSSRNSQVLAGVMEMIKIKKEITNAELLRVFGPDLDSLEQFEGIMSMLLSKQFCKVARSIGRVTVYEYTYKDQIVIPEKQQPRQTKKK
jgi:hypothetical protein